MMAGVREYFRPAIASEPSTLCAGCGNGILRGLIVRAIDEAEINLQRLFDGEITASALFIIIPIYFRNIHQYL